MNVDHFFMIDSLSLSRYAKEVDHGGLDIAEFSNLTSTPRNSNLAERDLYSESDYEIMKVSRSLASSCRSQTRRC
jgi:hypothetical protein